MNDQFLPNAFLQNKVIRFEDANISIATHALHYGTAAFAGMRSQPDAKQLGSMTLFRPELHAKRLSESATLLGADFSAEHILQKVSEFIAANPGDKPYYIRPLVYASELGVVPKLHDVAFDLLVYGVYMGNYMSGDGITCCISSWTRGEDRALPLRGKISGSYVSSSLAKTEAINRGYDEAIFLNSRGKIAEGSAMNIFMVKNGVLITPPTTADILEGITRRSILELAKEQGVPTEERDIDRSELLLADEVFLTGTAARIAPVKKIEQFTLPTVHPLTDQLKASLTAIVDQQADTHIDWLSSYTAATL